MKVKIIFTLFCLISLIRIVAFGANSNEVKMKFYPAKVSNGPLLFIIQNDDSSLEGEQVHYLVDPENNMSPQPFFRTDENVFISHRLDKETILLRTVGEASRLCLLNLTRGERTELLPGHKTNLINIEGRKIFFIEKSKEYWRFFRTGVRASNPKESKDKVYVYDLDSKVCKPIFINEIVRFWIKEDNSINLIIKKKGLELWNVSKDWKNARKIMRMEPRWASLLTSMAFSPDRKMVAFGISNNNSADLEIVDFKSGSVISEIHHIPIRVNSISPDTIPYIYLAR